MLHDQNHLKTSKLKWISVDRPTKTSFEASNSNGQDKKNRKDPSLDTYYSFSVPSALYLPPKQPPLLAPPIISCPTKSPLIRKPIKIFYSTIEPTFHPASFRNHHDLCHISSTPSATTAPRKKCFRKTQERERQKHPLYENEEKRNPVNLSESTISRSELFRFSHTKSSSSIRNEANLEIQLNPLSIWRPFNYYDSPPSNAREEQCCQERFDLYDGGPSITTEDHRLISFLESVVNVETNSFQIDPNDKTSVQTREKPI